MWQGFINTSLGTKVPIYWMRRSLLLDNENHKNFRGFYGQQN